MFVAGKPRAASRTQPDLPEKRSAARIPAEAKIIYTRFATTSETHFRAKIFDVSVEGMAFESSFPLHRGDGLFIRTEDPSYTDEAVSSRSGQCLRTTTLAEVKWCRETQGRPESSYRVGVKYASPYNW